MCLILFYDISFVHISQFFDAESLPELVQGRNLAGFRDQLCW